MAGNFYLTQEGKGLSQDAGGADSATLTWVGTATDEVTALADDNVPKRGEPHPYILGITADQISAVNTSGEVWTVTVQYSNNGRFIQKAKTKKVGYFEWTSDYKDADVSIPFAARKIKRIQRGEGQDSIDTLVPYYEIMAGETFKERRTLRILEAVVARTNYTQFDRANEEVGSVHEFSGGRKHQLIGLNIVNTSTTLVTVKYVYMLDEGTPYIQDQAIIRDALSVPVIIYREPPPLLSGYLRLPFTQTRMRASNDSFLNQPKVPVAFSAYTARFGPEYFQGWRNLPGFREPR
jgi:hypothetical protein